MYAHSTTTERPNGLPRNVGKREALILKAQSTLKTRIREAIASASQYQILSMTGPSLLTPGKVTICRRAPNATPVTVNENADTCNCIEHQAATPTKVAGIVARQRAALLEAGFTRAELIDAQAWPLCHHQLALALLQMEYVNPAKEEQNATTH